MYDPVDLHIARAYPEATVVQRAPFSPVYRLAYARKSQYLRHPGFSAIWQAHDAHDAYVSLLQIRSRQTLAIPLTCARPDMHWVYVLKGAVTLTLSESPVPSMPMLRATEYALFYAPPSRYQFTVATGATIVIHCCVKASWLFRSPSSRDTAFDAFLHPLKHQSPRCHFTETLPVTPPVRTELLLLAKLPAGDGLAVDAAVYRHIGALVSYSRDALEQLAPANADTTLIEAVRHYLREQVGRGNAPRILELADAFGVSQQHLNRLHRLQYGHSLKPYLTQLRMETALKLLHEGHSATDVAYRLDYSDLATFSNQFKAYHGYPPSGAKR